MFVYIKSTIHKRKKPDKLLPSKIKTALKNTVNWIKRHDYKKQNSQNSVRKQALNNKKKKGKRFEQILHQRRYMDGRQAHEKMLNISSH